MLQKQFRLPGAVKLRGAQTYTTELFLLKVGKNESNYSRFGFVVRKAMAKKAVQRNRVRRVFRSCLEEMLTQIKPNYDFLFLLKAKTLEMKREAMYNEIYHFLKEKNFLV